MAARDELDDISHVPADWSCCPNCLRWTPADGGTCDRCGTDVTRTTAELEGSR